MIRVIDDGHGMTHDDALLAFERHARAAAFRRRFAFDCHLGFAGSDAANDRRRIALLLERATNVKQGTRIEFAGGKLINVKPAGCPRERRSASPTFSIAPARRKFLKWTRRSWPTSLGWSRTTRWRIQRSSSFSHADEDYQLSARGKEAGRPGVSALGTASAGRAGRNSSGFGSIPPAITEPGTRAGRRKSS